MSIEQLKALAKEPGILDEHKVRIRQMLMENTVRQYLGEGLARLAEHGSDRPLELMPGIQGVWPKAELVNQWKKGLVKKEARLEPGVEFDRLSAESAYMRVFYELEMRLAREERLRDLTDDDL